jgi:hypothetical protein
VPPAVPPPFVVERIALGSDNTDSRVASTRTREFTVPNDAVSFTILGPTTPQAEVYPVRLIAPNGRVLLDIQDPRATTFRALGFQDHPFAAMYPNDPRLPLTKGKYQFLFAADRPTNVTVDVLIKKGPTPRQGSLPVTLWFAKTSYPRSNPLSAATAPNDPVFQAAITKWREIYATGQIALAANQITYKDLPADKASRLGVLDTDAELNELLAVANTSDAEGLNVYFIDQFNMPGAGGLLGISAGIPGVPSYPGLTHAGVAVALFPLYATNDPLERADFAATIAHEAGHYLGLYHTSERRGTTFDPIEDTPECRGTQFDQNGDRFVSTSECVSADASNLMFWTSNPKVVLAEKLTPAQSWVLLRNPSVK